MSRRASLLAIAIWGSYLYAWTSNYASGQQVRRTAYPRQQTAVVMRRRWLWLIISLLGIYLLGSYPRLVTNG
ncbi:MAG: hypothetical protein U9Q70_00965 [Chloroflexota bacterium]|nr:hypothetical protein [Chloroflexota bacterium]